MEDNKDTKNIIEQVSLDDVRKCLDEIGANSQIHKEEHGDDRLVTWLNADEEFDHDIIISFAIQGNESNWLKMQAMALKFQIKDNDVLMAYLIANKYNNYRRYGKLYIDHSVDDGEKVSVYVYEENLIANCPMTKDTLMRNVVAFLQCTWDVFSRFLKDSCKDFENMISNPNENNE